MRDSDVTMSSSESNLSEQESFSDNSEEMEVVGRVQPYQAAPLAEGDQDRLSPAVLRMVQLMLPARHLALPLKEKNQH